MRRLCQDSRHPTDARQSAEGEWDGLAGWFIVNELSLIEKELDRMGSDSSNSSKLVYKLLDAVLVKQDHPEAVSNVQKRLDFIRGEMCLFRNHQKC